jgi:TRAP-type C4-dicarboxylate transport system permease small subunit
MADQERSVWLGAARKPAWQLMVVFSIAFAVMVAAVIVGGMFFDLGLGLKQFLRPNEHVAVLVIEVVGLLALVFTGLYFSDFQGMIEPAPDGFFDIFSLIISRITMVMIALVVVVMFYEVVSRYVFIRPTLWANEMSLWIAAFIFLLAGLYSMQQRSHIRIYIIYDLMPRWMRKASDVLSLALLWGFTIALVWGGFNEASSKLLRMETFGTAWDPPIPATVKAGILIIVSLVAIQALSNLIADWNKAPESHSPMDDIDQAEIEKIRQLVKD